VAWFLAPVAAAFCGLKFKEVFAVLQMFVLRYGRPVLDCAGLPSSWTGSEFDDNL